MRVKLPAFLAFAACLLAAHAAPARAQQTGPPVRLSLGVVTAPGAAPTFYPLPDEDKKGTGAVIGVRPLTSARLPGGPPVDTVTLSFAREGRGARDRVSERGVARGGPRRDAEVAEGAARALREAARRGLTLPPPRRAPR